MQLNAVPPVNAHVAAANAHIHWNTAAHMIKDVIKTVKHSNEVKALLGKRVYVRLGEHEGKPVITTGQLLGFGDGGDFEILEDDGFVHYCWPMLEVEEVT